jgi:hypothetical protein
MAIARYRLFLYLWLLRRYVVLCTNVRLFDSVLKIDSLSRLKGRSATKKYEICVTNTTNP